MKVFNQKQFYETHLSYEEAYVKNDVGLPWHDALGRRLREFKVASGLLQEVRIPSFEHERLLGMVKKANGRIDHVTYWWLYTSKHVRKAVLLLEPYNAALSEYIYPGLAVVQVPPRIAPYNGAGYTDKHGNYAGGTYSFLVMSKINEPILLKIEAKLIAAASTMPNWDAVE